MGITIALLSNELIPELNEEKCSPARHHYVRRLKKTSGLSRSSSIGQATNIILSTVHGRASGIFLDRYIVMHDKDHEKLAHCLSLWLAEMKGMM